MSESIIGPVPEDWEVTTLGEICKRGGGGVQTGPFGSQLHASDYVERGVPSVMPQNIGDNRIVESGIARITPDDASRLERYLLKTGDIVYSRRGDVERRALVWPEQSGWLCGTGCLRVRPGDGADSRFLSYYLGHPEVRAWIVRHAIGATMPNLNTQILSSVPVVLPPTPIQEGIGRLLGALDDKIVVNDRIVEFVDDLAAAKIAQIITREKVQYVTLEEVADINVTKVTPNSDEKIRYIDISSVSQGRINLPDLISWSDAPGRARRGVEMGDTIWSTVRPERRSHALIMDDDPHFVASTGFAVIKPKRIGPALLYQLIVRDNFVKYLKNVAEGSAYPAVKPDRFLAARVPIFSKDIANTFEREAMLLRMRAHISLNESRVLAELRDTLLPKLISGELRIKDAERVVEEAV